VNNALLHHEKQKHESRNKNIALILPPFGKHTGNINKFDLSN
jgi:hypothetical protein